VLTLSWEDPSGGNTSLADQTTIIAVRLMALGAGGTSSQVYINGDPTPTEVLDGQLSPVPLVFLPGTITISPPMSIAVSLRAGAVELDLVTLQGRQYQLETSVDLKTWAPFQDVFTGTGAGTSQLISAKDKQYSYWRLKMLP
jgi:hypothetical protein